MRRFTMAAAATLLFAVAAIGAIASSAQAAQLEVRLVPVAPVQAGQPTELTATVTDAGVPAPGISVTFYTTETFARVTGDAEIGRAVTDASGVATVTYEPRETGPRNIRADATAKDGTVTKASASITVEGSLEQQYVQTAGIRIPGVNSWLIMGLLAVVWGTLLFIAVTVIRIAAAGWADGPVDAAPAAGPRMDSARQQGGGR